MRNLLFSTCVAIATLGLASFAQVARADDDDDEGGGLSGWTVALDIDYVTGASWAGLDDGSGGALRIGHELDLLLVTLIPELYLSHHGFRDADANITSGRVGGRLRLGKILEPGIFAHVGVARVGGGSSYWTTALDAGLSLDFTLLPLIDIGAHAYYDIAFDTADYTNLSRGNVGLHAALVF